jgi:hypothetical protein
MSYHHRNSREECILAYILTSAAHPTTATATATVTADHPIPSHHHGIDGVIHKLQLRSYE